MSDKTNPERGAGLTLPALALTRAGGNTKPAPASVYLLADHLDTVLAAAEDIVNARLTWNSARRAGQLKISEEKHGFRDDIEEIRKLENTIIIRVLKSRERAEDVARDDKRFRQLAKLYIAGTAVLLDAVEECGDSTDIDFATADTIPAYLRSRGLVDPDAPAPVIGENLEVGEDFLIAKRIAAGPLMDLGAALLDALELHYDLFLDENELAMAPQINRFEDDPAHEAHDSAVEGRVSEHKDPELEAAIGKVRDDASNQPDTSMQPDIWSKMSSAGSAVPPVISPPIAEPLVVVSKTEPREETAPESVADDLSEDDVPTEIIAATFTTDETEASDVEIKTSDPVSEPDLELTADDVDEDGETADDETLTAQDPSDDNDVSTETRDDVQDEEVLDANAEVLPQDESACDSDDNLIITAANDDDDTEDDDAGADDDSLDDPEAIESADEDVSLVADNTDAEPDPVEDSNADDAPEQEAASDEGAVAPAEAGAENSTSDAKNDDGKKKSKSLLGRLSLIRF